MCSLLLSLCCTLQGFVYVKFANQQGAEAAHRALNLRWYSGKQVRAEREKQEGSWASETGLAGFPGAHPPPLAAHTPPLPCPVLLQIIVEYQFLHVYASTFGVR